MNKKLQTVPMRKVDSLPKWTAPKNLNDAATTISELGRNMHEHAYLVGKTLLWVKKEIGRGKFDGWIKVNLWFNRTTAYHMMGFAKRCERAGETIEYHPNRSTVERLPPATIRAWLCIKRIPMLKRSLIIVFG